jgi:hypothetical protein
MLIAATLAMLGVPLWLVVGVLLLAFWSRRQFQKGTGVFPCRVREVLGSGEEAGWGRAKSHGRWVHDVLLLHSGLALIRYRALPVASVEKPVAPAEDTRFKGDALSIQLRLDDGSVVEVAGPAEARQLLVGPFGEGAT